MEIIINGTKVEVSKEELAQGIEAGQFEIKTDLKLLRAEDFDTLQKNIADVEYKKGKTAGEEMLIKNARETFGLDFEGKSLEKLGEAFKSKILKEASIEPEKKVQELTTDMNTLRGTITEWETKYNFLTQNIEQEKKQARIENILLSKLPKENLAIPLDDVVFILKSKHQLDIEDNNLVIKENGEILKNKKNLLNPITLEEWLPNVLKPYLKEVSGGAGGTDKFQSNPGSLDAFLKEMEGRGANQTEIQNEMQKRIKEGTLKIK